MMRLSPFAALLAALAFSVSALAFPNPLVPAPVDDGSVRLQPIKITDFENAVGLQRRSAEEFSDLDLKTQSQLIYGRPGLNGQLLLANMTLYAPDGLQMIMMERFEGLTSAVDCKGDDGFMSLTFNSENAFSYALKTWDFINEAVEKKFLLIANHDGCGPDDERQPYLITNIREDKKTLTAFLTAQTAPWAEIAGTYDLDFGKALSYHKPARRARQRGLISTIEGALTGSAKFNKSVNFDVSVGQQGVRSNIYTDDKGRIKIDCIDCFVKGSFQVTGHVSVELFSLKALDLEASPQNFLAKLELETTVSSTSAPDTLTHTKELLSAPIPGAGISVTGIFKLGAVVSYDVGISASFAGNAVVQYGLQASLPNTAKVVADVHNPASSSATGFDGGALNPLFDLKSLSASVTVAAFSQPKLSFGIELNKIGTFEIAMTMKLPEVSATLTGSFNEAGVCSTEAGASKTGVQLSSQVDVGLNLDIDSKLGDGDSKPVFSKNLFTVSHPLLAKCFPLAIPGLGPVAGPSTPSPIPSLSVPPALPSTGLPAILALTVPTAIPISSASIILSSVTSSTLATSVSKPVAPLPSDTGALPISGPVNSTLIPTGTGIVPTLIPHPSGTRGALIYLTVTPSAIALPVYQNGTLLR